MSVQPEALRLADEYEYEGFIGKHQFAREEWCRKAALELRRQHLENTTLQKGYDASRLEIDSLKAKVQEQEEMLAAVGAGGVEPLRSTQEWSYAGVKIWVGDKQARQITTQPAIENEGMTLTLLAQKCLDALGITYRPAHKSAPQPPADHFRDATEMVPVGWAISYDGKNPHALWTAGEGDLLDLEVKRQGGTACKMEIYARVEK